MTYLELFNQVLDRLREERITSGQAAAKDGNPYLRSIGAHINDAKDQVEKAWQWSQLRQIHTGSLAQGETYYDIVGSADNELVIHRLKIDNLDGTTASTPRWVSDDRLWKNNLSDNINPSVPYQYASTFPNGAGGDQRIEFFAPADKDYNVVIDLWMTTDALADAEDILRVPSLPVYSLATALASRERGETGAINSGELFMIADKHLSDAIAYDSARFPEELDWWSQDRLFNTNVRTA
jgi:hypothetical protein